MKKYLCSFIFAFMFCCITILSGCGVTPESSQENTTLTLAEAKQLVISALDVSTTNVQSTKVNMVNAFAMSNSSLSSNRNIFVKFVDAEFSVQSDSDFEYGSNTISGNIERNKANWTKYLLNTGSYYGYYNGEYEYSKNGDIYNKTEFSNAYFGLVLQSMDCMYIDLLFTDDAWDCIYNLTVAKNVSNNGYNLVMGINMSNYVDYVMTKCEERGLSTEGLFGDGQARQLNKDDGSVDLVISFNTNDNIISLNYSVTSYAFDGSIDNRTLQTTSISIKRCNSKINEPEWFDLENYN